MHNEKKLSRKKGRPSRNFDLVISGRSSDKTKAVLLQALAELPPQHLSGMKIHVVGIDAKELQEPSQRVGVIIVR